MMRRRTALAALIGVIGLVPIAFVPSADAQSRDRAARLLKALDNDQDGTVDLAEAKQAATAYFDRLDKDKDGTLTLQEFQAPLQTALTRAQPKRRSCLARAPAARETTFKVMGRDNDGTVTKDEYPAEVAARFSKADGDHVWGHALAGRVSHSGRTRAHRVAVAMIIPERSLGSRGLVRRS